jgi:signal transduction histidine kinase
MQRSSNGASPAVPNVQRLLAYVADLELEVDRLHKHGQFVRHQVRETLGQIQLHCADASHSAPALAEINQAACELSAVLQDLQESPGYHPAHDQVIAIAVRPLAEQVFRWQQRLQATPVAVLRLELESEHVEWFPARLRHILDNLIANALNCCDSEKKEAWVCVGLRVTPEWYEVRVSDNGVGLPEGGRAELFGLLSQAAPARSAGLRVGVAVVKLLVEQSGGAVRADSGEGQGTTFVVVLPRYAVDDYLL